MAGQQLNTAVVSGYKIYKSIEHQSDAQYLIYGTMQALYYLTSTTLPFISITLPFLAFPFTTHT